MYRLIPVYFSFLNHPTYRFLGFFPGKHHGTEACRHIVDISVQHLCGPRLLSLCYFPAGAILKRCKTRNEKVDKKMG